MNILVTGGASGVGKAITQQLAANQDHVFFTYFRSTDAAKALEASSSHLHGIRCDFKDPTSLNSFVDQFPKLDPDVLVNNALTGMTMQHFHKMESAVFSSGFQDNIFPVVVITQAAIKLFRKKKFGKIINVLTSYLAGRPPTGLSEYVASKAYLASLSKSWAVENASFNITSNSISPSIMRTNLTSTTDERVLQDMEGKSPLKKFLEPQEVATAVQFLVDAPHHVNGINMLLNGASDVI